MTNALVDIYGFIHTTTSSNANSSAMNVATSTASAVVVEESEPTEISEADFLARVAAFERNEQIEAQRARTRMARWTQQQQTTMIKGGNRDRKQCQLETYDRWNPNGKGDDDEEDEDDDGKGMVGLYTAWKPPVKVEHDEYRQPPPLSHSHRPHQHQPPHSFSIILDNPRSQCGSGHQLQENDESVYTATHAYARPNHLDDDGSKLRRPLSDITTNYTRLRPSTNKTRVSVVTDRSFLLPNRNSLVLVTTPAAPNTNTNTHDGQARGRNPVFFASSSPPQDTAAATAAVIVSSMKNSKSKSSVTGSEKPITVESRRITRRTMTTTTSAAGGLREYRVPAHYHYHYHYHHHPHLHPRPRPAGPVSLPLPGPHRRQVNPILVACACAC
ncbi:hypothetical protein FRC14_007822 [Serendipita sp. 396]|nr:hypothetical protein FRC14_007822 [Serendipita sp. 396]KAG8778466.1 hypothetical protein FRC15_010781 [Serendipita sp. 397]KAG8793337.1 hypothetical protein FRC16_011003 [Serendipita sp. 398]